jgi:hypothetical protein
MEMSQQNSLFNYHIPIKMLKRKERKNCYGREAQAAMPIILAIW